MRKWLVKVHDYPQISPRKFYRVKITNIEHKRKPEGIEVTVQHLSPEQEGRCNHFALPVPIRVSGLAAQFFRACNLSISVGEEIDPMSAVGTIIEIRFSQNEAGDYYPAESKRIETKENNDVVKN